MKQKKKKWIIGVDEVGRGPLAGPVAVGVFATSDPLFYKKIIGIRDSKKLSERDRVTLCKKLTHFPESRVAVSFASVKMIDTKGISFSIQNAIKKSFKKIQIDPTDCEVFLDGSLRAPVEYVCQKTIIRGDVTEPIISAAAIVAKVKRDIYMKNMDKKYPKYHFGKHKGYGTKEHIEFIQNKGICPLHRVSFCKNIHYPKSA